MKKIVLLISLAIACLAAKAQIPQPDPDTTARHFLIVASIGNLQEVSDGQQAGEKGMMASIRSFGQMMVKDHGSSEHQLLQLAISQGISLPAAATGGIQPDLDLKNADRNFDSLYIHDMLSAHRNTVEVFQVYAVNGKNPAVRAFAQQMLPVLKAHLAAVKALDKQLMN